MNADAELDAAVGLHASIAVDETRLHLNRAAHRIDHAAELDDATVARALDDASAVGGDGGVDQVAAKSPKARKGAVLIRPGEPAVADHVRHQDRGDLAHLAHGGTSSAHETSMKDSPRSVCLSDSRQRLEPRASGR